MNYATDVGRIPDSGCAVAVRFEEQKMIHGRGCDDGQR